MGQRGVAEATRAKFRLETFSHSTVSRSFRSFEEARKQAVAKTFGEEAGAVGEWSPLISAAAESAVRNDNEEQSGKRFRTVADTLLRRDVMRVFFPVYPSGARRAEIEASSIQFVKKWHKKTRRLLF